MRDTRNTGEQYRWALWAAALLAVFIAFGCGATDPGASGDDGAAHTRTARLTAIAEDIDALWTAVATPDIAGDAAHSAAWMEALDGLAMFHSVPDAVGGEPAAAVEAALDGLGIVRMGVDDGSVDGDALAGADNAVVEAVTPAPYAVLDTSVQLTEAQVVDLLRQAGFDEYTWPFMLRIAWCESRFSPNATGAAGEMGLWQVHPRWHPDATYDPLGNALAAYRISSGGYEYSAWSCRP